MATTSVDHLPFPADPRYPNGTQPGERLHEHHAVSGKFGTALVVEDDPVLRRALVRGLRGWGLRAYEASGLIEAERVLQREPDLVVTDVRLPDGTGQQVVRRATRLQKLPFIVAMSGEATPAEAFELARAAVRLYLEKPFTVEELGRRIASTMALEQRSADPNAFADDLPQHAKDALNEQLRNLARERALTPREVDCVRVSLAGTPRADLPQVLSVSENTCKTLVRGVLRKCAAERLADVTTLILIRARWQTRLPY